MGIPSPTWQAHPPPSPLTATLVKDSRKIMARIMTAAARSLLSVPNDLVGCGSVGTELNLMFQPNQSEAAVHEMNGLPCRLAQVSCSNVLLHEFAAIGARRQNKTGSAQQVAMSDWKPEGTWPQPHELLVEDKLVICADHSRALDGSQRGLLSPMLTCSCAAWNSWARFPPGCPNTPPGPCVPGMPPTAYLPRPSPGPFACSGRLPAYPGIACGWRVLPPGWP